MPFQKGNKFGKRFQPGHSGNAGGRPKKLLTDLAVARLLAKDLHLAREVARRWIEMAKKNPKALEELLDRVEGKVPLEVSGKVEIEASVNMLAERLAKARARIKSGSGS